MMAGRTERRNEMKQYNVWFLIASTGNERCLMFEAKTAQGARNKFASMYGNTITRVVRVKGA